MLTKTTKTVGDFTAKLTLVKIQMTKPPSRPHPHARSATYKGRALLQQKHSLSFPFLFVFLTAARFAFASPEPQLHQTFPLYSVHMNDFFDLVWCRYFEVFTSVFTPASRPFRQICAKQTTASSHHVSSQNSNWNIPDPVQSLVQRVMTAQSVVTEQANAFR